MLPDLPAASPIHSPPQSLQQNPSPRGAPRSPCGRAPAEPVTVAANLAARAVSHARATLRRRLAAIGRAHRMRGLAWMASHPIIRDTLSGILSQARHAAAACRGHWHRRVATAGWQLRGSDLAGLRDQAMLLLRHLLQHCAVQSWSRCSGNMSISPAKDCGCLFPAPKQISKGWALRLASRVVRSWRHARCALWRLGCAPPIANTAPYFGRQIGGARWNRHRCIPMHYQKSSRVAWPRPG